MPNINIAIRNKVAKKLDETEYICGNSDFLIDFDFDAEWDAYETKTARFVWNNGYQDIVFMGKQCEVPVISNTNTVLCGVFAGDLHTTTPALIPSRKSILCGNPAPAALPSDVFEQMLTLTETSVNKAKAGADSAKTSAEEAQEYAKEIQGYTDFEWYPRGWHEQYDGVVIKETTLTWSGEYATAISEALETANLLDVGDSVVVYWDGEAYECTVIKETMDSFWKMYIGNFANVSDEPFYIYLGDNGGGRKCIVGIADEKYIGKHTFSVYAVEKKNLLPDKFLPDTVVKNGDREMTLTSPGGKLFKITVDDNGALTATALS